MWLRRLKVGAIINTSSGGCEGGECDCSGKSDQLKALFSRNAE
jgi:hypothetical protein